MWWVFKRVWNETFSVFVWCCVQWKGKHRGHRSMRSAWRLLHVNVMRVKIRRQLTWVQWWRQQPKTLHAVWSNQSLLTLTHDSVCFVPCLADGPEISTDQEGAVPPYPSSASAFPVPGLSLSARHHHPIYPLPSLWWIPGIFLNPAAGLYCWTCWLCLWKRLFATNPARWIAGKSCKRPGAASTGLFCVFLLLILWSELLNML